MNSGSAIDGIGDHRLEQFLKECGEENLQALDLLIVNETDVRSSSHINQVNYFMVLAAKQDVSHVQSVLEIPKSNLYITGCYDKDDIHFQFELAPLEKDGKLIHRWQIVKMYGESLQQSCRDVGFDTALNMDVRPMGANAYRTDYLSGNPKGDIKLLQLPILGPCFQIPAGRLE
jgi:hypothetical protein